MRYFGIFSMLSALSVATPVAAEVGRQQAQARPQNIS
jgi:hypothetical protein